MITLLGLAASGAIAGLLGAILGIGGGVFMIPMMVLFFDVPMPHAVATGLVMVIATSCTVTGSNMERGTANWRLGLVLELMTVAAAIVGAFAAGHIAPSWLMGLFGVLLIVSSAGLWRAGSKAVPAPVGGKTRGLLACRYYDTADKREVSYGVKRLPAGLAASAAAGGLSGLLGIGGGVIIVPSLNLFCGLPMKAAAATSNFMVGMTAAASAFLYFGRGQVQPVLTAAVVLGVLAGAAAGTRLNRSLKDLHVSRAFAILLIALSVQMLWRAFHAG